MDRRFPGLTVTQWSAVALLSLSVVLVPARPVVAEGETGSGALTGETADWCGPGARLATGGPVWADAPIPVRSAPDVNAPVVGLWERRIALRPICTRFSPLPSGGQLEWRGMSDPSGFRGWLAPNFSRLAGYPPPPLPGQPDRAPRAVQLFPVQRDPRFGINQAGENSEAADEAGAGWSRLVFWWSAFQYGYIGDWHSTATADDWYINSELAHGRELAGVVLSTPQWAGLQANSPPKNLHLPWNHPQNHWGQFMHRLAKQYAGKITTWIIWNEVDVRAGAWRTWDGSVEDYVQLLKVAYQAIKAADPHLQVAHFGAAYWYDRGEYLSRFLDVLATDPAAPAHNYFFDIGNLHLYSRAADIPRVISWYREQLASRGIPPKPVWVGETNAVPYNDPAWPARKGGFMATLDEQASFVVQALATYVALDVARVGFNRLVDGQDFMNGGEPLGLIRNDGSRRPAFQAFKVATRLFSGTRPLAYHEEDGVVRVVLERDGERITVAWTLRPEPMAIEVRAIADRGLAVSKYGAAQAIEPGSDGLYRFALAPATANSNDADPEDYVVGGEPLILIERWDGALASAPFL